MKAFDLQLKETPGVWFMSLVLMHFRLQPYLEQ